MTDHDKSSCIVFAIIMMMHCLHFIIMIIVIMVKVIMIIDALFSWVTVMIMDCLHDEDMTARQFRMGGPYGLPLS